MKAGDINLFEELTPPNGGLDRLRARLDHEPVRQHRRRALASAAIAMAATAFIFAVAVMVWPTSQPQLHLDMATILAVSPAAVRLGLATAPSEPVSVASDQRRHMAVERVEVADQKVLFYRVTVISEPS